MRAANLLLLRALLVLTIVQPFTKAARAQEFDLDGNRKKAAISFNLVRNLVVIPLYINNKGPYNFILDTGVGPLIITEPTIIPDLGLKNLRPVKISGLGKGLEIDAFLSSEISAKTGHASITNIPTAILKEDIFGLSNYLGIKVYGLLGYYFFKSFIVELNYSSKRLVFYLPETKRTFKGEKVPIEIINNKPYTNIQLLTKNMGSVTAKVVIDNGASHAISLETLNEKPFPVPENAIEANLGIGLSGPISGSLSRIPELKIGSFILKDVISSYPIYDDAAAKTILLNRNGNLGADILNRFNITFDYNNEAMYLRKNANYTRTFEHDMSGIELYVEGSEKKRYIINRIEPGSPANLAGILPNDEILTVNFTQTSSLNLIDLTRTFRAADGKIVYMTINRAGSLLFRSIKLKKRI